MIQLQLIDKMIAVEVIIKRISDPDEIIINEEKHAEFLLRRGLGIIKCYVWGATVSDRPSAEIQFNQEEEKEEESRAATWWIGGNMELVQTGHSSSSCTPPALAGLG